MNLPPWTPELRDRYTSADPFPHLVLDGVFGTDLCARAASEYPPPDDPSWHTFTGPLEQGKQEGRAEIAGAGVASIHHSFASDAFVHFLRVVSGVPALSADDTRKGGGIHQVRADGRLGLHTDFTLNDSHTLERRVNVILFVADAPWPGADLVLYTPPDRITRITPHADRLVIFECGDENYHGHPDPLEPPTPQDTRRSIPAYYFAPARPGVVARSTKFLENVR